MHKLTPATRAANKLASFAANNVSTLTDDPPAPENPTAVMVSMDQPKPNLPNKEWCFRPDSRRHQTDSRLTGLVTNNGELIPETS